MKTKKIIKSMIMMGLLSSLSLNVFATSSTSGAPTPAKPELAKNAVSSFKPQKIDLSKNKNVIDYFHKLLPTTTIDSIYTAPYPDTYALIIGTNVIYGNLNSPYITVGHVINVYTQDDLTANLLKVTTPKIDISTININDAILDKSSNKVNKKIIIFSDPDCPYCRQLEQQLVKNEVNKKADIYYMLMPLPMHPNAKAHTTNIMCSTTPIKTLQDYMLNNKENPTFKSIDGCNIEPALERVGSIARQLNINATPTIITGSGVRIMGADINAILDYVDSK